MPTYGEAVARFSDGRLWWRHRRRSLPNEIWRLFHEFRRMGVMPDGVAVGMFLSGQARRRVKVIGDHSELRPVVFGNDGGKECAGKVSFF